MGASQARRAEVYREAMDAYQAAVGEHAPSNVADLHAYLVREHDYAGSLRSVQRFVRASFPAPKIRGRRRIETPPCAQAQVDWAHFPGVLLGELVTDAIKTETPAHAFLDQLPVSELTYRDEPGSRLTGGWWRRVGVGCGRGGG